MKSNNKNFIKKNIFKIIFSIIFFIFAILYLFSKYFNSRIDTIFIFLMLLGFLPWLAKYIKSIEAFGIKSELVSDDKKEKIDEELSEIHSDSVDGNEFANYRNNVINNNLNNIFDYNSLVSVTDSISKLVLCRVEIENKLKLICKNNGISYNKKDSLRSIVYLLRKKEVLVRDVANVMLDLLPILNDAVHSNVNSNYSDLEWVIDKCEYIIDYLNFLLNVKK